MRKVQMLEATGEVENIVVVLNNPDPAATPYTPPDGRIPVDDDGTACKGGRWDGAIFGPPPPPPDLQAEQELAIAAATTLDDLKTALLGTAGKADRAAGR